MLIAYIIDWYFATKKSVEYIEMLLSFKPKRMGLVYEFMRVKFLASPPIFIS